MKNILGGINNKKINDLNIMEWSNTNYLKYIREKKNRKNINRSRNLICMCFGSLKVTKNGRIEKIFEDKMTEIFPNLTEINFKKYRSKKLNKPQTKET